MRRFFYEAIFVGIAIFYEAMPLFPFYSAANYMTPQGLANIYDSAYLIFLPMAIIFNINHYWDEHIGFHYDNLKTYIGKQRRIR